jgi:hypothetical protein
MKKSENMRVWLREIVVAQCIIAKFVVAGKMRSKDVNLYKRV